MKSVILILILSLLFIVCSSVDDKSTMKIKEFNIAYSCQELIEIADLSDSPEDREKSLDVCEEEIQKQQEDIYLSVI